ncbi:MAG TPA: hypothetical protein P5123_05390 [Spirochaetota bacterium]|nr:hypothetical protein [Spirochaetota bacterium]
MNEQQLKRALKRHIVAEKHKIYVQCAPGFEEEMSEEIAEIIDDCKTKITEGGIELKAGLDDIYKLNLISQCASRVLLRITRFYANTFTMLFENCLKTRWELYLKKKTELIFSITVKKSKLYHTARIEEEMRKAISTHFDNNGYSDQSLDHHAKQMIHVRVIKDIFYISLDATGEPLYKRGYKEHINNAPLRENIAASILRRVNLKKHDLLIDPMCGSGTFSLEAMHMSSDVPPGIKRSFTFEIWPAFKTNHYDYLKKNLKKNGFSLAIMASDIDPRSEKILLHNTKNAFCDEFSYKTEDFFNLHQSNFGNSRGILVLNPPFGKRFILNNQTSFYNKIIQHIQSAFTNHDCALIIPANCISKIKLPDCEKSRLKLGGYETFLIIIKREN